MRLWRAHDRKSFTVGNDDLDAHDNVVQGLITAKLALEMGRTDEAMAAVEMSLAEARQIVGDLLTARGDALGAGGLRRGSPAGDRS